jgi:hypothetical protein
MNWPKRSTDCWNAPDEGQDTTALAWLGGGAEVWIYVEAPFRKQPFGDVDTIPVFLAPGVKLTRGGIQLWRELQVSDPQFELGGENRSGRNGAPPIGVAAFARMDDRYRHRPRSYSALGERAAGIIARVARSRLEVRLPLFLLAAAVRLVAAALVASGRGWLRLFARRLDGCGSWQPFVRLLDVCALQRPSLQRRCVCGLERLSVLQFCAWDSCLLRHDQLRGTALKPKSGRDARNADVWSWRPERKRPGFWGFCL